MVLKKYPFGFKSYFEVDISQLVFKIGSNPNNIVKKQYLLHVEWRFTILFMLLSYLWHSEISTTVKVPILGTFTYRTSKFNITH